ncbi:hypothetical protein E3Q08_03909, partial [Wallemia mellicola]
MKKPVVFSRSSWKMLFVTQSPTLNTPRERLSPLSMLSMHSRDKEESFMVSVN